MIRRAVVGTIVCSLALVADTLVLRSGKEVEGTYLGGDSRRVRMAVGDNIENFDVSQISEIRFGAAPAQKPAPTPTRQRVQILKPDTTSTPAPVTATARPAEIPAGSSLVIRMIDDVDSQRDQVGATFRASLDEAVTVEGQEMIPRNADVVVKLIEDKQSGRLTGRTELTLDIVSVSVNGRTIDVATQEVTQASDSRTTQTAQRAGGGAAIGAIIGAIAGGGKGAAIGAATGAAAGGAVQVLTKGQRVRIPSETRLTFTLQQPVRI